MTDRGSTHRARPAGRRYEGRREVDAHSRQRTAPLAGKSLAGAYRPSASPRVAPFDADGSWPRLEPR